MTIVQKNVIIMYIDNILFEIVERPIGGAGMPKIKPITELRNTTEISEICHSELEPVFITKNGYGDMVVMSIETYEQIIDMNKIDGAIYEAENTSEVVLLDAREGLASLRRKHFG